MVNEKTRPFDKMYFNISDQKQICNIFFTRFSKHLCFSPLGFVPPFPPTKNCPQRRGNFTEPLGGTQRQEGRIGSEPLRVLQRFGELTENRWRVTAQKAAGVVWYTEQGLFPDQKIRRREGSCWLINFDIQQNQRKWPLV